MKTQLVAVAFIVLTVLTVTGCTVNSSTPTSQSGVSASPEHAPTPTASATVTDIPEAFLTGVRRLFPEDDPTGIYEAAAFHCASLNSSEAEYDEIGKGLILDAKMTTEQAVGFMGLAVAHVCPERADAFDAWTDAGGRDRLAAIAIDRP